jgi:hypothetical protein
MNIRSPRGTGVLFLCREGDDVYGILRIHCKKNQHSRMAKSAIVL